MAANLDYLVAPLLLAFFGLPAGFAKGVWRESTALRLALMFMTGSVAFVVWETALSLTGVKWSFVSVVLPLGASSLVFAWLLARSRRFEDRSSEEFGQRTSGMWNALAIVVCAGCAAHLALSAATAHATSIDLFYFWGPKAIRFAANAGIDAEYLGSRFAVHTHTPYPPLVPLISAWSVKIAGYLPWRAALVSTAVWVVIAYPIVLRGFRSRLPVGEATIASGVWMSGMSLALAQSHSAGNAEPPLVFFTTVAIVAAVAKEGVFPRWVFVVALCGAVLTKSEGAVVGALILSGAVLRDLLYGSAVAQVVRRFAAALAVPAAALGIWIAFELRHGLPLTDPAREAIGRMSVSNLIPAVIESLRNLEAGSGWLAWGVALFVIALSWRSWKVILPALAVVTGMAAFLIAYYLHHQGAGLDIWVAWTLPRVSLTALSAALIGASVGSGSSFDSGGEAVPET